MAIFQISVTDTYYSLFAPSAGSFIDSAGLWSEHKSMHIYLFEYLGIQLLISLSISVLIKEAETTKQFSSTSVQTVLKTNTNTHAVNKNTLMMCRSADKSCKEKHTEDTL